MKHVLLFIGALLASTTAFGADKAGEYAAVGARSCGKFIEARGAKDMHELAMGAWIAGYITAYNQRTPDTYNVLGGSDLASAKLWLENWCKANPLLGLGRGAAALTDELHPRRHKTAKEAGR